MCGIAGIAVSVSHGQARAERLPADLRVMTARISHRGPNGTGIFIAPNKCVGVAMNTLAILAAPDKLGPYQHPTGCLLTFNGEIYNWRELSHRWKVDLRPGDSDAVLLLEGYARYGWQVFDEIDGMYAFAIYDPRDQSMLLVRDRFGEKPLYWGCDDGRLYFASEAKALCEVMKTTPVAPPAWLVVETPLADETAWAEVRLLPPGHLLRFDLCSGTTSEHEYWRLSDVPVLDDWSSAQETFAGLLDSALRICRPAEPLALAVSGGLDSAVLAYAMRPELLITVQYPGIRQFDELAQVEHLAADLDIELIVLQPTADEFRSRAAELVGHLDYPVGNASLFPELLLYEAVAERGVRIVAGGTGPDELLLGYVRHHLVLDGAGLVSSAGALRSYLPLADRFTAAAEASERTAERYFRLIRRGPDIDPRSRRLVYEQFRRAADVGQALTLTDLAISFPPLQLASDKLSSKCGLERRSPYLVRELAEFCFALPVSLKRAGEGGSKRLLREAARQLGVPNTIADEPNKRGFGSPIPVWLGGELAAWCDSHLEQAARDRSAPPLLRLMARRALGRVGDGYDRTRLHALLTALWWLSPHGEGRWPDSDGRENRPDLSDVAQPVPSFQAAS